MKTSGGNLVAHRVQQFELPAGRQAGGREVRAFEIAGDALVLSEENLLVHLLEIERVIEGEPDARILELVAADVEGEGLHDADIVDRKFLEDDALFVDRREIVGGGPVLGAVLGPPVDGARLERLDGDRGIAEIIEPQLVEIVLADIDVDVPAPIILDALVDDAAAGRKLLDAIGAAAERRFERGFTDVAFLAVLVGALPPILRQDFELADDLRQRAVAGPIEREGDLAIAGLFGLDDRGGNRRRTAGLFS